MSIKSSWLIVFFKSSIFLLIFCVLVLSITGGKRCWKHHTNKFIYFFFYFCIYFIYFESLLLGIYTFRFVMSSLLIYPFFVFIPGNSLFSEIYCIWYQDSFSSCFRNSACKICLFHYFTFNLSVSLYLKWVSCREYIVGSCFNKNLISQSLCLLTCVLRSFTFNVHFSIFQLISLILFSFPSLCSLFLSSISFLLWD